MTNRKILHRLAFVLLLSPCLLNSGSKEYIAKKIGDFLIDYTTNAFLFSNAIDYNATNYNNNLTEANYNNNNITHITLNSYTNLVMRMVLSEKLKTNPGWKNNLLHYSNNFLLSGCNLGFNHYIRNKNNYTSIYNTEHNVIKDSFLASTATALVGFGMDLIEYYCFKQNG